MVKRETLDRGNKIRRMNHYCCSCWWQHSKLSLVLFWWGDNSRNIATWRLS